MNVDLGIWDRLRHLVVFLLFIAGVLAVVVWYLPLIRTNERNRLKIMQKNVQVRKEEEKAKQMDAEIRALRTDPRAVERIAREKLGYVKPGETRFQFDATLTNAPARR